MVGCMARYCGLRGIRGHGIELTWIGVTVGHYGKILWSEGYRLNQGRLHGKILWDEGNRVS